MHKYLAWIVEYAGQHTEDFFPDGDAEGDHSEADWFANAQAAIALADADNCRRCTDCKLPYKSMHKYLAWIVEYAGQHTEDFFPDGDAEGDHSEAEDRKSVV